MAKRQSVRPYRRRYLMQKREYQRVNEEQKQDLLKLLDKGYSIKQMSVISGIKYENAKAIIRHYQKGLLQKGIALGFTAPHLAGMAGGTLMTGNLFRRGGYGSRMGIDAKLLPLPEASVEPLPHCCRVDPECPNHECGPHLGESLDEVAHPASQRLGLFQRICRVQAKQEDPNGFKRRSQLFSHYNRSLLRVIETFDRQSELLKNDTKLSESVQLDAIT